MPRRKAKYDHVKVYRPNGVRYAHGNSKVYFSALHYPIAMSICVQLAVKTAMENFYAEFREGPQGNFVVETAVVGENITATVIELEVRDDGGNSEVQQQGRSS